tara:strand:- start:828 stop:2495 length:1668 start_codon:yes stop_codon:yes gene_type:complete
MAYDPVADKKQYVLTNILDSIDPSTSGPIKGTLEYINEKMADDPDRWDDDVWRFMGQRIGGALIGGGVGSFGGPKGTAGGAIIGGVLGFDNSARILGKIPGMNQLAKYQNELVGGAQKINEKLTPWLDPRVAGWGTRLLTDYLLERGVRSGVGKVKAVGSKYSELASMSPVERSLSTGTVGAMRTPPTGKYQLLKAALRAEIAPRTKLTTLEKTRLRTQAGYFQGEGASGVIEAEKIPLNKYTYVSQPNGREIIDNVIQPYRRAEVNDLIIERVTKGEGYQVYMNQPVVDRLRRLYNASDEELTAFLDYQNSAISAITETLAEENLVNYYKQIGKPRPKPSLQNFIDEAWILRQLGMISTQPDGNLIIPWYKDLGHKISTKNLFRSGDVGGTRASNIEPEPAFNFRDKKGIRRLGNRARRDQNDLPKLANQLMGVSRTIDEEFLKFRHPELQMFMDEVLPPFYHNQFVDHLFASFDAKRSAGILGLEDFYEEVYGLTETQFKDLTKKSQKTIIRKWKKQLDWMIPEQTMQHYPIWIREIIDDYIRDLNTVLKVKI